MLMLTSPGAGRMWWGLDAIEVQTPRLWRECDPIAMVGVKTICKVIVFESPTDELLVEPDIRRFVEAEVAADARQPWPRRSHIARLTARISRQRRRLSGLAR